MGKQPKYAEVDIKELSFPEHVRLRPGMYLGNLNNRGLAEQLKNLLSNTLKKGVNSTSIKFLQENKLQLRLENFQSSTK